MWRFRHRSEAYCNATSTERVDLNILKMVPQNLLSRTTGRLVRIRFPQPLGMASCWAFARAAGIDLAEAEKPLSNYRTIEDLFTRKLAAGRRTVESSFVSPADGYLVRSGQPKNADLAVQVKGIDYSLKELVFGKGNSAQDFSALWYATVYLAPHNYHRVHASTNGSLTEIRHIPGRLWPVNQRYVSFVPQLFCENERLTFTQDLGTGQKLYTVMVGALNVGRITTPFLPDFATNSCSKDRETIQAINPPRPIKVGDELGTFMLGSTVVLVLSGRDKGKRNLVETESIRPILMGQTLESSQS